MQFTIARQRATAPASPQPAALEAALGGLSSALPELRRLLLAWWQPHGRHTIPWKLRPDGSRPADGEPIDPYPIWCAEVMRAARQHSSRVSPASPQWTVAGLLPLLMACLAGAGGLGWPRLVVRSRPSRRS